MPAIRRRRAGDPAPPWPGGEAAWVRPAWRRAESPTQGWTPIGLPWPDPSLWLVDPAGGLNPAAGSWSVEWWVGADDRWHVPSRDGTARQRLVDGAPVVETRIHVRGGDVVLTEWAVPAGLEAQRVAVVVCNESVHALAVAAVLRPWGPAGPGGIRGVAVTAGRLHADTMAGPLLVEGQEAPAHVALPEHPGADSGPVVLANGSKPLVDCSSADPAGWANGALIWPLARQGTLHVQVTAGPSDGAATPSDPAVAARGWAATTGRGARFELPEGPLATAIAAQIPRLLLAPGWPGLDPGGVALVVDALAAAGFVSEADAALDTLGVTAPGLWAAGRLGSGSPRWSARAVGEAAEQVARSFRHERFPEDIVWGLAGLQAAAGLLADLDEDEAAVTVRGWVDRESGRVPPEAAALAGHLGLRGIGPPSRAGAASTAETLLRAAASARHGSDPTDLLAPLLAGAGATWSGPDADGGYDPHVSTGWWAVARALLVDDGPGRLVVFPTFLRAWKGQPVEVHDLPTAVGRASWALRWHGERPALLWDVEGEGPVSVTAPGLDPAWMAGRRSGDALLRA